MKKAMKERCHKEERGHRRRLWIAGILVMGILSGLQVNIVHAAANDVQESETTVIFIGTIEIQDIAELGDLPRQVLSFNNEEGASSARIKQHVYNSSQGSGFAVYEALDHDANIVEKTVEIHLLEEHALKHDGPTLHTSSRTVQKGDPFDILEGVSATDSTGRAIAVDAHWQEPSFHEVGTHRVFYSAVDDEGFLRVKEEEITVVLNDADTEATTATSESVENEEGVDEGDDVSESCQLMIQNKIDKVESGLQTIVKGKVKDCRVNMFRVEVVRLATNERYEQAVDEHGEWQVIIPDFTRHHEQFEVNLMMIDAMQRTSVVLSEDVLAQDDVAPKRPNFTYEVEGEYVHIIGYAQPYENLSVNYQGRDQVVAVDDRTGKWEYLLLHEGRVQHELTFNLVDEAGLSASYTEAFSVDQATSRIVPPSPNEEGISGGTHEAGERLVETGEILSNQLVMGYLVHIFGASILVLALLYQKRMIR